MSSVAPRGLAKYVSEAGIVSGFIGAPILPLIFGLATTSPRLVGEMIKTLGLTANKLGTLGDFLGKFLPASKVSAILNVAKSANSDNDSKPE